MRIRLCLEVRYADAWQQFLWAQMSRINEIQAC